MWDVIVLLPDHCLPVYLVQVLLVLAVFFTQGSKVEDLFCGSPSGSQSSIFFRNYLFGLGFKPVQDDFRKHDFT